ncbi:MAG TPA: DUF2807 domain-containing protein [Anaerolineae bacterium]|nr:DUF2807 domain-containing protein [Anaerolineae bacterium]
MKHKLHHYLFGLVLIGLMTGCSISSGLSLRGSGDVITLEYDFTDFDRVAAGFAFNVDIRQGESFSVVVRVDDNLEQYLEVVQEDDILRIGLELDQNYNFRRVTLEAVVTMPSLSGVSISGTSSGTITGFSSTHALDVNVSGASSLSGDIEAGDASIEVSGSSRLTLTGSAEDVIIHASGSSVVDLENFPVTNANIDLSGASQTTVLTHGRLDVEASGGSTVYYLGDPTLGTTHTSGGSSIERK